MLQAPLYAHVYELEISQINCFTQNELLEISSSYTDVLTGGLQHDTKSWKILNFSLIYIILAVSAVIS